MGFIYPGPRHHYGTKCTKRCHWQGSQNIIKYESFTLTKCIFIQNIRNVKQLINHNAEMYHHKMAKISRRSIVATRELTVGHSLSQDDVSFQRPGTGLMPYQIYSLLGRTITKPVASGELLRLEHFSSK